MKRILLFFSAACLTSQFALAQNVGVDITNPAQKLDVDGALKLGNTTADVPGSVRFNTGTNKFQIYENAIDGWRNIGSGSVTGVTAGNGISVSGTSNITVSSNPDNITLETNPASPFQLRVKDLGISTAKIQDNAVTTLKINNLAVTEGKLATNAVSTIKIADNAVTVGKIAGGTANQILITDGSGDPQWFSQSSLLGSQAGDGLVYDSPNAELDVNVDGATIQIGTVAPNINKLLVPANGITAIQIAADAVGSSEIAADAVGSSEIAADAVGSSEISTGAVTTTEILDGTIRPADISAAAPAVVGQVLSIAAGPSVAWVDPSSLSTVLRDADADTKIQVETSPDEDRIRFYTGPTAGGTQRMIINNNGNVGIGITNVSTYPDEVLEVAGNIKLSEGSNRLIYTGNGTTAGEAGYDLSLRAGNGSLANANASAGGNVVIEAGDQRDGGSAVGGGNVDIKGGTNVAGGGLLAGEGEVRIFTGQTQTNPSMKIQANGNVGIGLGNLAATYQLHIAGKVKSNGINETSDARLKKNVSNIDNALQMVMSLNGKTYNWRTDEFPEMSFNAGRQYGFIAQEVEKVIPEVVGTDNEGWKSIEYSHLVPVLLEAIKEQQAMIESLKKENNEYSDALNTLKAEVSKNASLINVLLEQSAPASSMKQ